MRYIGGNFMGNEQINAQEMIENLNTLYSKQVSNLTIELSKAYVLVSKYKKETEELRSRLEEK